MLAGFGRAQATACGLRLICDLRLFRAKIIKYEATLRDDLSLDPGCGIEPHVCCGQRREREGSF